MSTLHTEPEEDLSEEYALATLLRLGICYISGTDYRSPWPDAPGPTCAVAVNCNDLFYWGSADSENLPRAEILTVYRACRASKWGVSRWCCLHRGLRPQLPIVKRMKAEDAWDNELESLPTPAPS